MVRVHKAYLSFCTIIPGIRRNASSFCRRTIRGVPDTCTNIKKVNGPLEQFTFWRHLMRRNGLFYVYYVNFDNTLF